MTGITVSGVATPKQDEDCVKADKANKKNAD